jgi:hypothetical protein
MAFWNVQDAKRVRDVLSRQDTLRRFPQLSTRRQGDDFVICFQYRSDAVRVKDVFRRRLSEFGRALGPTKPKLAKFDWFAQRHAGERATNRPETISLNGSSKADGPGRRS